MKKTSTCNFITLILKTLKTIKKKSRKIVNTWKNFK